MSTARDVQTDTAELIARRYGAPLEGAPAEGTPVVDLQLRHRSVRRYLPGEVSDAQLELLIAAAQSGSQSSNLQVWSVVAVRDQDRKDRISTAIGGRRYVEECEVFLVWVVDFHRATQVVERTGTAVETNAYLENTLVGFVDSGISAQNALLAAESLGLGGVFVGSVRNNPLAVAEELGLPEYAFPAFGLAIGHPDPAEEADTKPRLPQRAVLHHEQYDDAAWESGAEEYEERLREYYARYGKPDYSWARTLGGRVGPAEGLHGRQQMREWLSSKGLLSG
ncbi:NADPH-dependent oxidoreductase [Gulosibacter sp. 10]|uniref:NADPH-dependent oxidoreductase n=1 Tax=Gulosibacter sp. 10 TaxID=1255570 RepID=UPI00097EBD01|nr:NADPH-dependent oxidoreductase [Gulosibacter sp. 10]SJM50864.1 Nitroreductase [Gulosibacter sp. 10]